jgi:flagellar protein FliO/FliZ
MTQTLVLVAVFVFLLALLPMGVKWLKQRAIGSVAGADSAAKIVSVLAVGPQQRVVTVEQGPDHARVRLTLGVTAHTITLLHSADLSAEPQAPAVIALPDSGRV